MEYNVFNFGDFVFKFFQSLNSYITYEHLIFLYHFFIVNQISNSYIER
jgi:hypothetical protein